MADKKFNEKFNEKYNEKFNDKYNEKFNEYFSEELADKSDEKPNEKFEERFDEIFSEEFEEKFNKKFDEKKFSEKKFSEKFGKKFSENFSEELAGKSNEKSDEQFSESFIEHFNKNFAENFSEKLDEKFSEKFAENSDEKFGEKSNENFNEKFDEKKSDEQFSENFSEHFNKNFAENFNEKLEEKSYPIPPFPGDASDRRRPMYNMAGITFGSSVLGIRYQDGVMIATDTLVCYGGEMTYTKMPRVYKVNDNTLFATCGDYPDYQYLTARLKGKVIRDFCFHNPNHMKPSMLTCWLTDQMYKRRLARDPLTLEAVVGGLELDGSPYLVTINRRGGYYEHYMAVTGPACMCVGMIAAKKPANREFNAIEAAQLIDDVMMVLYYRDTVAVNTFLVGICSRTKCSVVGPFKTKEDWTVAKVTHGY